MQVIPAINCNDYDFECVLLSVSRARKFLRAGDWLHLDAADGVFTFNKTWRNATEWANLRSEFNAEVHLMVENPEKYVVPWIAAGAKRLIVHAEALNEESAKDIVRSCTKRSVEAMLSSNPHTPISKIWPYLRFFSHFQVLAVEPGLAGQKFIPSTLEKVRFLRNFAPNAMIEVDGGINLETAKLAKVAGANVLIAASYIFGSENNKKAYNNLKKL